MTLILQNSLVIIVVALAGCASAPSSPSGSLQSNSPPPTSLPSLSRATGLLSSQLEGLPQAVPLPGTGRVEHPEHPGRFTFVVFGDNRPGKGESQPETVKEIFAEIHELHPAFALSLGDIIEGKPKRNDPQATRAIREQFKDFLSLAATAGAPIFNAPGNHEMDDEDDIPTKRMHELYTEFIGPTYGAFNYGNSRFIVLNTEDIPPPDAPRPPPGEEFSYMSPKQIAELKEDLGANQDKTHIFITMHYPIYARNEGPPKSDWDDRLYPRSREALAELFQKHDNIAYVLAAHEHLYYNPHSPDNVTDVPGWKSGDPTVYLVSGGAGAPLNEGKGGFHHYLVFTVDGDAVTVKLIKLDSKGASS